ncbi:MAG: HAMP domain-containing histidine kinase [Erysipelotrichales bacterium]|nr:HAMP domain-containing histidine kinase [Erysipelotrichales bacterium]
MRFKIRSKLLCVLCGIILVDTLAIWFLGNSYIDSYYKYRRDEELAETAQHIKEITNENPLERRPWFSYVKSAEEQYMDFLIFDYVDQRPSVLYTTDSSASSLVSNKVSYQLWINKANNNNVFASLELAPDILFSHEDNDSLYLYAKLKDNQFLFISTPLDYIKTTSSIAIEFYSYILIISACMAFILIFIASSTITKPIVKISKITQKISKMQFDERCEVSGNDELTDLAKSVNMMSDQIKNYLDVLIEKNEILKKDLDRQEENERLRRQFVANVSHDFKTPLALIQAYTEVLKEDAGDIDQETCTIILSQVKQMNILVNQLLSLTQLESGLVTLQYSFFSLHEVISSVLRNLSILMEEKDLTYSYSKDEEYIVSGDYQQIHQVIQNLIENAVKYTPQGSSFHVHVRSHYSRVRIEISNPANEDLTDEVLPHLFDSFYMTDRTRNATLKSYGLGLAIVKAIMELHEQSYGAYLEDGNVVFYITLDIYSLSDDEE